LDEDRQKKKDFKYSLIDVSRKPAQRRREIIKGIPLKPLDRNDYMKLYRSEDPVEKAHKLGILNEKKIKSLYHKFRQLGIL